MFKPTTEVLTKNGWKKIVDIEPDTDMVACVKPDTLGIQFKHVKHKLYLDNTPVVHFTNGIVATGEQTLIFYAEGGSCSRRIDFINNIKSDRDKITLLNAGSLVNPSGLDISSREMVFLLITQEYGVYNENENSFEFNGRIDSLCCVDYLTLMLDKLGYKYEILNEESISVTDKRAVELYNTYFNGKEFKWIWLDMNATQACYFLFRVTTHYHSSWLRVFNSESENNLSLVQAVAVLNQKGSYIDYVDKRVFTKDQLEPCNIQKDMVTEKCDHVYGLDVEGLGLIIRENGYARIVGTV